MIKGRGHILLNTKNKVSTFRINKKYKQKSVIDTRVILKGTMNILLIWCPVIEFGQTLLQYYQ